MREVTIEWKGMNPSDETKERMQTLLKSLKFILPPDSDIRLAIEKYPKNYEGHCVVRSPLGDFAAQEKNKDPFILCKELRRVLKQQIFKHRQTQSNWHKAA